MGHLQSLAPTNQETIISVLSSIGVRMSSIAHSTKYAIGGQLGVVVNKVKNQQLDTIYQKMKEEELNILGSIPFDENLISGTADWDSNIVKNAVKEFYFRLNLPQENS